MAPTLRLGGTSLGELLRRPAEASAGEQPRSLSSVPDLVNVDRCRQDLVRLLDEDPPAAAWYADHLLALVMLALAALPAATRRQP